MNTNIRNPNRVIPFWRVLLWGGLTALLLMPALMMQFTTEVDWSLSDFVIMGILLAALGLGLEAVMRFSREWPVRVAVGAAVVLVFAAIWAELAVGIFGTHFAGS